MKMTLPEFSMNGDGERRKWNSTVPEPNRKADPSLVLVAKRA